MAQQIDRWKEEMLQLTEDAMRETDSKLATVYREALKDIKQQAKQYIANYETLSFSKRLEAEQLFQSGKEIQTILNSTAAQVTKSITNYISDEVVRGYYGTWYEMDGLNNMSLSVGSINQRYIEQVVNAGVDGSVFSKIYGNTDKLAKNVEQAIIKTAYDGKGYAYAAKKLEAHTLGNYSRAMTIARTEGGRAQTQATQSAYDDASKTGLVFRKEWMSAEDRRVRRSHQQLNGQKADDDGFFTSPNGNRAQGPRLFGVASEDINCRCTTVAVFDDVDYSDEDAYHEWVKSGGSFEEWLKLVDGDGIINVKIDSWTDCLVDRKTGKALNTQVVGLDLSEVDKKQFGFNWDREVKLGRTVKAIKVEGVNDIQGIVSYTQRPKDYAMFVHLVENAKKNIGSSGEYEGVGSHLFAIAAKEGLETGNDAIFFESKTKLFAHYEDKLNAKRLGHSSVMEISAEDMQKLVDKYFK